MVRMPPDFEAIRKEKLKQIVIQLLPALIERASLIRRSGVELFEFNHEDIVQQAYKFAGEVVRQGGAE